MQITHEFELSKYGSKAALDELMREHARLAQIHRFDAHWRANADGRYDNASWLGVENAGRLAEIVARGDAKLTDQVKKAHKKCTSLTLPMARSIKPVWADRHLTGTRVDVDALIRGAPRAWGRYERSKRTQGDRTIALYVTLAGNCGLTAAQISWAPVPALVVADLLEAAGYRCEIWGVSQSRYRADDSITVRFPLKRAEDTLDLNTVARVCCPAVLRAITFSVEANQLAYRGISIGYGHGDCSGDRIDVSLFGESGAILCSPTHSLGEAVAEITRVIKNFQE